MSLADGFRRLRAERAARAQAIAGIESGRVGRDSSGQAARTFHCNFSSVKLGGGTTALAALDYALRERENERDAGDVEAVAGDKQRVLEAAAKIEDAARVRTGPTAERILVKETFELPADSTPGQRAACALALVADWRRRGHEAVAAVHVHGEELPQPHLHVLATARPLNPDGTVKRESSLRPFASKASVRNERANVAALVNEHCAPEVRFHPGKLADTGIERAAKKRIPQGAFREARAEIRAAPEKAAAIEAEMYAASRTKRAPLHGERTAAWLKRAPVIEQAKAAGEWPPQSERRRLEKAEASVAALTGEKQEAETRADTAEKESEGLRGEVRQLQELNERQTKYVTDWHGNRKVELPDLATVEGQSAAWANMRAWEAKALKKARDEAAAKEAAEQALADERDSTQAKIDAAVRLALEAEKQEQNRDGRGTGEAGGAGRRPDQGADRPGTEARRGGGAEDHGAGRAERPRAGGDRPEGDDGREQTGGVGQPASAGGPHAVDGNVGGDRGAAPARGREGVESRVVAAPDREDAGGLAREHGPVEEPGVVETPANRRGGADGADVGGDRGGDWNWLLEVGGAAHAPEPGRPVVAEPPPDVVVSGGGKEQQKAAEPPPPARPWKDLSDDELVNHWDRASRREERATTAENKDDARRKIEELHAEAKHRDTTLKALDARKQRRDDRGR